MAEAYNNTRLLEGLYTLGYPMSVLKELSGQTGMPVETFKELARQRGVNPDDWGKVTQLLDFRASGPTRTALYQMLAIMGASAETQRAVQYAGDDPQKLLQVLNSELGPERAGALMIKATGGNPPQGTVWNPFRGDMPPKGVDLRHGDILGIHRTASPGSFQGQASTTVRGQDTGLPVGPNAKQAADMAATNAAAAAPRPGSGTGSGTGAGSGTGSGPRANFNQGMPAPKRPVTDQEKEEWVKAHFGADAWFLDVPEVRKILFDLAASGSTDGAEAARKVSGTSWYKNTSSASRAWTAKKKQSPEDIISDVAEQTAFLDAEAKAMGLEIRPERLSAIAESSLRYGWSPVQIKKALGAEFHFDPKAKGQIGKVVAMKQQAARYLVPLSDEVIGTWGEGLLTGQFTDEQFTEYLKGTAKSLFPQLNAALDAGHTVADYVDPYKQIAAQTLELPGESIDFMDPKWRKALDQVDPKTGQRTVMTLSDWTSHLKTDKSYGYDKTKAGIGEAANLATSILKKFGKIA